jgi:hypothetical protein
LGIGLQRDRLTRENIMPVGDIGKVAVVVGVAASQGLGAWTWELDVRPFKEKW